MSFPEKMYVKIILVSEIVELEDEIAARREKIKDFAKRLGVCRKTKYVWCKSWRNHLKNEDKS